MVDLNLAAAYQHQAQYGADLRLLFGNLPERRSKNELLWLLKWIVNLHGACSIVVVTDRSNGLPIAFVQYQRRSHAEYVWSAGHYGLLRLDGRVLRVEWVEGTGSDRRTIRDPPVISRANVAADGIRCDPGLSLDRRPCTSEGGHKMADPDVWFPHLQRDTTPVVHAIPPYFVGQWYGFGITQMTTLTQTSTGAYQ